MLCLCEADMTVPTEPLMAKWYTAGSNIAPTEMPRSDMFIALAAVRLSVDDTSEMS